MNKKEEFKNFIRLHPELINYVENNQMTWQKFYDIYDIYGDNNDVWNKYLNNNNDKTSWNDVINIAKNIDVDKLQSGISSIQKAIGLVGDLFVKDNNQVNNNYTPRPLYRSFED